MIGLVLITHGRLADELRSAMEHVVGPQRQVATVCIGPEDETEGCRAELARRVEEVDAGDGAIVLTDMFGGTPSNLAISMLTRPQVDVIAGVNLPMLVKLAKIRSQRTLVECVDTAEAAGRKYISSVSHLPASCRVGYCAVPAPHPPARCIEAAASALSPAQPVVEPGHGAVPTG